MKNNSFRMKFMLKHFYGAIIGAIIGTIAGAILGWSHTSTLMGAVLGAEAVLILGLMESSESLDNAIVDYGILKTMDAKWQRRYMTWGMPIAVVGMRFTFPVLIVSAIARISPWKTIHMALFEPARYAAVLTGAHNEIAAFGGAFLLLISLSFFMDEGKDEHWIGFIEKPMQALGAVATLPMAITILCVMAAAFCVPGGERLGMMVSGLCGIIGYILVKDGLGALIGDPSAAVGMARRAGLWSLLYLECIDGSFSFDGVISAFAITSDPVTIAIGLGVGALTVRSLTMMMLKTDALSELAYVENGAFFSILVLSLLMFLGVRVEVPDYVTGLVGAVFIGAAFWASLRRLAREKAMREALQRVMAQDPNVVLIGEVRSGEFVDERLKGRPQW
ncbi:DUF475 domain-containing protein [Komagataeibacter sp. FNDCR1]|nr:DUF475 domain-containing protein [Komagataeibacter sp. FNDCR1]